MTSMTLQPGHVSPRQRRQIHAGGTSLALAPDLRATVQRIVADDEVVYGINTGEPLAAPVVRLILATKAASLSRGHSGVRPELVDALLALANAGLLPRIPATGSVGESGDLAPLAHMACVLIGEGQASTPADETISGREAMAHDRFLADDIEAMRLWAHQGDWPASLLNILPRSLCGRRLRSESRCPSAAQAPSHIFA